MTAPALALSGVSVTLDRRRIVAPTDLALQAGRLVAVVGPNGAGKSTLLKAVAGVLAATGRIAVDGRDLATMPRREAARCVSYLPQGHAVHWSLTVRDVVALGRYPHGLADPGDLTGDHRHAVEDAMARTDTLRFADRSVLALSGGERARVMLARVLAVGARIILADEPTASLDPRHQITVMQDLKGESRRGTLVVAVTHDLALAARLADEIVVIDHGFVVAHGSPEEVLTDDLLARVYGIGAVRRTVDGETLVMPWSLA
ncbi:MAG: ABC transporter ATP-binding protein [Alsobacter sp.]